MKILRQFDIENYSWKTVNIDDFCFLVFYELEVSENFGFKKLYV